MRFCFRIFTNSQKTYVLKDKFSIHKLLTKIAIILENFSTIDCLLNKPDNYLDQPSLIMCEAFAIFFNNKITQIRTDIAHNDQSCLDELGSYGTVQDSK